MKVSEPFYISRGTSELIIAGWAVKMSNMELSDEDIKRGEETVAEMERIHRQRLVEFENRKENKY